MRRTPHAIAVAGPDAATTYDELARLAGGVIAALADRDLAPDARVAVLAGLGIDSIAATLGILGAGRVAAPLSAADPPARLARHRELTDPAAVIVTAAGDRDLAARAGFEPDQIVTVSPESGIAPYDGHADLDALALLITTSGSTGQPKAVMHSNRSLLSNARRYRDGLNLTAADRVAWHSPLSGGQGIVTMTTALLTGATLCPFPLAERGAAGFSAWLRDAGITVIDTLPSVMRHLASTLSPDDVAGIRLVRIASEAAYRADYSTFRQTFPATSRLVHVLASTETGIIAQYDCSAADPASEPGRLPAGQPVPGIGVVLIDGDGAAVPQGEVGTLVVTGSDIALGYWRAGAEDAARFSSRAGGRSFSSSDLAMMTNDGLVMQGRSDLQVKVRGHRIQIDEVEAVLLRDPAVAAAGVTPITMANGDTRLLAKVVARAGRSIEVAALRASAATALPGYAVPAQLEVVPSLPLTTTGKLDRVALTASVGDLPATRPQPAVDPQATADWPVVDRVAAIWARAFGVDAVDRSTGFVQLGGDSLLAAVIGALINDEFDIALTMTYFRRDPSIEQMAADIESGAETGADDDPTRFASMGRANAAARAVPSYTQVAMLAATDVRERVTQANVAVPYRIEGDLEVAAFERAINGVVNRHEILRTIYPGAPSTVAQVPPRSPVRFEIADLRADPRAQEYALELLRGQADEVYDLATGPLLRFSLLRLGNSHWRLHRFNHHVIADNWSWQIFFEEVAARYEAELSTQAAPPSEPPMIQYADFAAWERATFGPDSAELDAEVDWWQDRLADFSSDGLGEQVRTADRTAAPSQHVVRWGVPTDAGLALDTLAREVGATYFDSRLAVVSALLGTATGARDIPVWTQMTHRTSTVTLRMIGPLVNPVWLPLRFDADMTMRQWTQQVRRVVTEVSEHSAIPRAVLQARLRARGIRIGPWPLLFQADQPPTALAFGGVTLRSMPRRHVNPGGLEIAVSREGEDTRCTARFNPHVVDATAIGAIIDRLAAFGERVASSPDQPIRRMLD